MGSARAEAGWAVAAVACVFWLVALGGYGLILLGVSAMNRSCYPTEGIDQVQISWTPPGYACRRVSPTYRFEDHPGTDTAATRIDGPGPTTAAFQLLLLVTPIAAWIAAGRTADGVARRRDVAEVLVVAAIGLASLAGVAVAVGSTGLASIFLLGGAALGLLGGTYLWRTRANPRPTRPVVGARTEANPLHSVDPEASP